MELGAVKSDELNELAASWLNKYRRQRSPKTIGRRVTSLRFLGKALRVPILIEYTVPRPAEPEPHPLPNLSADLVRMILVCRDPQHRALIALCGLCGLRITEARSIKWRDFDMATMSITVRGKGDKTRKVPVSRNAWLYLAEACVAATMREIDATIITFSDKHSREIITKIARNAGLSRHVSSHDLRATFATEAYEKSGHDIVSVQRLLGHSSPTTTQRYIGTKFEVLRGATEFNLEFEHDDDPED